MCFTGFCLEAVLTCPAASLHSRDCLFCTQARWDSLAANGNLEAELIAASEVGQRATDRVEQVDRLHHPHPSSSPPRPPPTSHAVCQPGRSRECVEICRLG